MGKLVDYVDKKMVQGAGYKAPAVVTLWRGYARQAGRNAQSY